jgi:O-antigen/teichoic acid export membrane protein
MKAAVIIIATLIVLAHPAVAIAVFAAELAACAALGGMIWRARRPRPGRHRRRLA